MNITFFLFFSLVFTAYSQMQGPRVSIITSVYKGDHYILKFLQDITRQTIFDQCQLIIVNANSPGDEERVIKDYMKLFSNIVYIKLAYDPGLYGVWNMGIKFAQGSYITNANLDDRLHPNCYQIHAAYLDNHPDVDVVYSGCYSTKRANETFELNNSRGNMMMHSIIPFNRFRLFIDSYPLTPNPMWRKDVHKKYGLFDHTYKSSGDTEMWVRAAFLGNAKIVMIPGVYGLYYHNPAGLSTKKDSVVYVELNRMKATYKDVPDITTLEHIEYL
jgi:glycosyltransferase involved in cell wall biosynthesis